MKQKLLFLFFCMIFVAKFAFSQKKDYFKYPFHSPLTLSKTSIPNFPIRPFVLIPANFYASQLGFMCKKESQFESATNIPLRIRLGSVATCDRLEGKKYASWLPAY